MKKLLLLLFMVVGNVCAHPSDNYLREAIAANSLSNLSFALEAGADPNHLYNGKSCVTTTIEKQNWLFLMCLFLFKGRLSINDLKLLHKNRIYWAPGMYNIHMMFCNLKDYYDQWVPFFSSDWNNNSPLIAFLGIR